MKNTATVFKNIQNNDTWRKNTFWVGIYEKGFLIKCDS